MKRSEQSQAGSPARTRRQQSPTWIGMGRAFDGDDVRLIELQAREFPLAMRVLFDWSRDAYRRAEQTVGTGTVLGDLAAAEQHPDPRCLREFYAYVAAVYRRQVPGSVQGELPLDGKSDEVRMVERWREWLGSLFRRMIDEPELLRDVLMAQIHATAPVGRKAGKRVMVGVWERIQRGQRDGVS